LAMFVLEHRSGLLADSEVMSVNGLDPGLFFLFAPVKVVLAAAPAWQLASQVLGSQEVALPADFCRSGPSESPMTERPTGRPPGRCTGVNSAPSSLHSASAKSYTAIWQTDFLPVPMYYFSGIKTSFSTNPHSLTSLSHLHLRLRVFLLTRLFPSPFNLQAIQSQVTMFAKVSFSAAAAASVGAVFLLAGTGTGVSASPVQGTDVTIIVWSHPCNFLIIIPTHF
jgi:hypothetical protein